jgi:hypothetical protein
MLMLVCQSVGRLVRGHYAFYQLMMLIELTQLMD